MSSLLKGTNVNINRKDVSTPKAKGGTSGIAKPVFDTPDDSSLRRVIEDLKCDLERRQTDYIRKERY